MASMKAAPTPCDNEDPKDKFCGSTRKYRRSYTEDKPMIEKIKEALQDYPTKTRFVEFDDTGIVNSCKCL